MDVSAPSTEDGREEDQDRKKKKKKKKKKKRPHSSETSKFEESDDDSSSSDLTKHRVWKCESLAFDPFPSSTQYRMWKIKGRDAIFNAVKRDPIKNRKWLTQIDSASKPEELVDSKRFENY